MPSNNNSVRLFSEGERGKKKIICNSILLPLIKIPSHDIKNCINEMELEIRKESEEKKIMINRYEILNSPHSRPTSFLIQNIS